MRWWGFGMQWHLLDHLQTTCTSLHQHLITQFLQAECSSWRPTNSVKALKAIPSPGKFQQTVLVMTSPVPAVSPSSASCFRQFRQRWWNSSCLSSLGRRRRSLYLQSITTWPLTEMQKWRVRIGLSMSSPATSTSTQEHTKHVHIQYVVQETNTQPFNGPLSWTTQVSRYQKGKPIWVLLKQETVSGSGISWAICKSASCSRQTTTPAPHRPPLKFFYRPDALPATQHQRTVYRRQTENDKC